MDRVEALVLTGDDVKAVALPNSTAETARSFIMTTISNKMKGDLDLLLASASWICDVVPLLCLWHPHSHRVGSFDVSCVTMR